MRRSTSIGEIMSYPSSKKRNNGMQIVSRRSRRSKTRANSDEKSKDKNKKLKNEKAWLKKKNR